MEKLLIVAEAVIPVFVSIFLGMYARKTKRLSPEEIHGIQQFVVTFALPFVLFQSCYTADFGLEAITSMAMVLPLMLTPLPPLQLTEAVSPVLLFTVRLKLSPTLMLTSLWEMLHVVVPGASVA